MLNVYFDMKKTATILVLSLAAIGCSNITKEGVKAALVGQNYLLINAKNDTIQVEFTEKCVENYRWDITVFEEWDVVEVDDKVLLHFNGHEYEPKLTDNDEYEFYDKKNGEKAVKSPGVLLNLDNLEGEWLDARYAGFKTNQPTIAPPPPCPNMPNDTFFVPGIVFKQDNCIVTNLCDQQTVPYSLNLEYGVISIGDKCGISDQYRVKQITANSMKVDVRFQRDDKYALEFGKVYLKSGQ